MIEERFDVIVVGGGVGGLAAAYACAKAGLNVIVIERGEKPGSKNVVGGRLYAHSIKRLFPDFPKGSAVERPVTREVIGLLHGRSGLVMEFENLDEEPQSYTVLRARFDAWFASMVEEAGGIVITGIKVDDLIIEDGFVKGIVAGEDKLYGNIVIAADGALSMMAERAGLRRPYKPEDFMLGVKEVVKLPKEVIEERFRLEGSNSGAAHLYIGDFTMGVPGGGFLYTNKDTISVGIVVKIGSAIEAIRRKKDFYSYELITRLTSHPHLAGLLKGGEVVEYSAHIIPEPKPERMPKLYGNGIIVVGDAAGLIINTPFMLRGMDLAIASGMAAAEAAKRAHEIGKFDAVTLSHYEAILSKSVLLEVKRFIETRRFMENERFYTVYPELAVSLLRDAFRVSGEPKEHLKEIIKRNLSGRVSIFTLLWDLWKMQKIF